MNCYQSKFDFNCSVVVMSFLLAGIDIADAQVSPTNEWVNFYSSNTTFNGEPIPVGALVDAYDPNGVHCGTFTVTTEGSYGFLLVYRDDQTTDAVDEGAGPGDAITFRINGFHAGALGPAENKWTFNGDVLEVDLVGNSIPTPVILVTPNVLNFGEVKINTSESLILTISNLGDTDLNVIDISTNDDQFVVDITSFSVNPGYSRNVSVTCEPLLYQGEVEATLTITSSDPNRGLVNIDLIGTIVSDVVPTNEWVGFYSSNTTFNGEPIPVGAVVDAYDPDGVHCGTFTVTTEGSYGFLSVYRDDQTTDTVDEGADPGDAITFRINGFHADALGPEENKWTFNGDVLEVDLVVVSLGIQKEKEVLATTYNISQNFPNPFNPTTTIRYELPENSRVTLMIYDIRGREVRTLINNGKVAGYHSVLWNGKDELGQLVSTGVYIYRIFAQRVDGGFYSKTRKMVILK